MISRYIKKGVTWVDINNPAHDELISIKEEFLLSNSVIEDLEQPSLKPSIYKTEDYIYAVTHLPTKKNPSERQFTEIDSILSKHWLITVRYDKDKDYAENGLERLQTLADNFFSYQTTAGVEASYLLYKFFKDFYEKAHDHLDDTEREIDTIKKNLFTNYSSDVVNSISKISFMLIDMSYSLRFHHSVFDELRNWSKNLKFDKLVNYEDKLESRISFLQKIIRAYQATTESVLQNKSTDAIKTLSLMSFVVFPLSLIAAVFSMSTRDTPIVNDNNAFYKVMFIMFTVFIMMMVFFKKKRWI